MIDSTRQMTSECPTDDISAYVDGELALVRELEMDAHFARCTACSVELNQQKQFLCSLNSSLRAEKEIELPANFTKQIVANAESSVSGLRRPHERYNAVFICIGLFLFVLFAMGAEVGTLLRSVYGAFEQVTVVGGFFGRLVYSMFIGVVIVMRSLAGQLGFDLALGLALAAFSALAAMLISRKLIRMRPRLVFPPSK
jgi:anti-sigma factor RsiW